MIENIEDKIIVTQEQKDIINSDEDLIVEAKAGTGKCLKIDTPIIMFDGTIKKVQDIKIGDLLMGDDSTPRKVLNTTKGFGKLYKIIPKNGDTWICNDVHVLTLQGTSHKKGLIRDIALNDLIKESSHFKLIDRDWKLFKVPVEFPEQKTNFDPYLMGLWLGDGTLNSPQISNPDKEIVDYLMNLNIERITPRKVWIEEKNCYSIHLTDINNSRLHINNPLRDELKLFINELNEKKIPENYLINSRENRLKLLAGLLDTDGYFKNGGYEIIQKSKELADNIVFLARSLGYKVSIRSKIGKIKKRNFEGNYYRIFIYGNLIDIPIKVERKKPKLRKQIKNPLVSGFRIEDIGDGDYYGFTLDGNGRFLLGDFTVTHNTTTIIHYALKHNNKRKLYLAFNKSIKEEADIKFAKAGVKNINILTVHGLAYKTVIFKEKYVLNNSFNVFTVMNHYNSHAEHKIVSLVLNKFNSFCDSNSDDIDSFDFVSRIKTTKAKKFYEDNQYYVDSFSRRIWNDMLNKKIDCSFSFYLKKFQLNKPVLDYDIIMIDECLPYHTPILLANGESLPIGKIVDEKLSLDVLTYNTETGKQESCKITNWQKNPNNRPMLKINFLTKKIFGTNRKTSFLVCTDNHKIWADGKWVEAKDLKVGMKCQIETSAYKTNKYKISSLGKEKLSKFMTSKNLDGTTGTYTPKKGLVFLNRRGNGKLTEPQIFLKEHLDSLGFIFDYEVPIKTKKQNSLPNSIKIDIANKELKIAIELDGNSHNRSEIKEKDERKDDFLIKNGWLVFRIKNKDVFTKTQEIEKIIIEACLSRTKSLCLNSEDCPEDTYITSIEKTHTFENYTYDITVENNHNFYANGILVHNCQDLNEVILDIIQNQKCRILAIGDSEQAIYGWRGAVDAIKKFPYKKLPLTNSFRFGQDIADIGVNILSCKKFIDKDFDLSKINIIGKGVSDNNIKTKAILSRSNLALLDLLFDVDTMFAERIEINSPYIEGGIDTLIKTQSGFNMEDLYYLYTKDKSKIKSKFLHKFDSLESLTDYYEDLDDLSVKASLIFFKKHADIFDFSLRELKESIVDKKSDADWILSTIHKAKGNEYDYVKILKSSQDDGFPINIPKDNRFEDNCMEFSKYYENERKKHLHNKDIDPDSFILNSSKICLAINEYLSKNNFVLDTDEKVEDFKNLYQNINDEKAKHRLDMILINHLDYIKKTKSIWLEELNIYYVAITRAKKKLDFDFPWLKSIYNDR